jgi:site-specific DNA recombinase
MRLLAPARISRMKDESTSVDTQLAAVEQYARAYGHELIPVVPDLSVSGAMPIRERPGIGPCLSRDRLGEWDGVITYRLDRLFRDQADFVLFYRDYCERYGKVIISAGEGIDTSNDIGKFVASILVMFAEMERGRMRVRRRDAAKRIREALRWNGGKVPYGYEPYKDGPDWYLRPHPEHAKIVRWLADEVIGGRSCVSLTIDMNRRGILSAMGKRWSDGSVLKLLRSPVLRGYVYHWPPWPEGKRPRSERPPGREKRPGPEIVLGDDGMPLRREPVLDDATWTALQAALDRHAHTTHTRRETAKRRTSRLLRVAFCALCKRPLYAGYHKRAGGLFRTYRCIGGQESKTGSSDLCPARNVPADWLEPLADELFLAEAGDAEIYEPVYAVAEDHSTELAETEESITRLEALYLAGKVYKGTDGAERFAAQMSRLEEKRDQLAQNVAARTSAPRERPTGRYFRDKWAELDQAGDDQGKRSLMISAGFKIMAAVTAKGRILSHELDESIAQRAALAASGRPVMVEPAPTGITAHDFYTPDGQRKYFTPGELGLVEETD